MKTIGITKIRNESHIIADTLDSWSEVCDAIIVYDDASDDHGATAALCRDHQNVIEVIESNHLWEDRLNAEWYNRQLLLNAARRFDSEWIAYFDGDEHLFCFDKTMLDDQSVHVIATTWHDMYITPEDESLNDAEYQRRRWCSAEYRQIPFFYRNDPVLSFTLPDQRIMGHRRLPHYPTNGLIQHWGKGHSIDIWQRKVEYYGNVFGRYADKWKMRDGAAVHQDYKSDEGNDLILWEDLRKRHDANIGQRSLLEAT